MTKRTLTVIVLCVLTSTTTHGQFVRGYGLKVGAVSATQTWDFKINVNFPAERRWGIDAGAYVEVLDIPYVSLLGELHYIQKGFSMTLPVATPAQPEGTGEYVTKRPRVDYLSVPLLMKLRFDMGVVVPYFFGGPRLDIFIAKKPEGTQAVLDKFKSTDVGVSLGAGLEVPLTIVSAALVEFRYSPSFNEAFSNNNLTVKNQSIELLLGVRL
jgi:hypothetical protein